MSECNGYPQIANPPHGHTWDLLNADVLSPDRFQILVVCPTVGCEAKAVFAYGFHAYEVGSGTEVFNKYMQPIGDSEGCPEEHMTLIEPHSEPDRPLQTEEAPNAKH